MTFSLRPSRVSVLPCTEASVRTRVVSWNEAAEMKDRVCSEALVMPSNTGWVMAARPPVEGPPVWTLERVLATFPRLAERLGHGGQQLSGGEQQMLSISRALMTHPKLMILDEATEGLAPLVVAEIWRVIALIRDSGLSTLVVDRNVQQVLAHTDRAVVMENGRLVLEGESSALAADAASMARYLGV